MWRRNTQDYVLRVLFSSRISSCSTRLFQLSWNKRNIFSRVRVRMLLQTTKRGRRGLLLRAENKSYLDGPPLQSQNPSWTSCTWWVLIARINSRILCKTILGQFVGSPHHLSQLRATPTLEFILRPSSAELLWECLHCNKLQIIVTRPLDIRVTCILLNQSCWPVARRSVSPIYEDLILRRWRW